MKSGTLHVAVCEAALHPTPGATSLLFPVDDTVLAAIDPAALAAQPRDLPLVYVGNQYDRDAAFEEFFAPAAARFGHVVAGKWPRTAAWPHVTFVGRVPFYEVAGLHGRAVATVLLLPERYAAAGQMTQRLVEAVTAGCLPLCPTSVRSAARFVPDQLHVANGADVITTLAWLQHIAGSLAHTELIAECLQALQIFGLARQLDVVDELLASTLESVTAS